ncbi:MAG: desulfoferrodoxin [Eggerthellaceae bacterium]|nr:desulfoferrodoxin [Eggerthellaceae bacterium]
MKKRETFYVCKRCGNIIVKVVDAGVPVMCCGQKMEEIEPNTFDAAGEKHVPVIQIDGNVVRVTVGEVIHPMEEDHFIQWIYLVTAKGVQAKCLKPGEEPLATFVLEDDEAVAALEYCNKHGLWRAEA